MALKEGDLAPDFELLTDENQPLSLASLRGKRVVLFFYPKADTSGCTTEACGFRDAAPRFDGLHAVVLGISPDKPSAQAKFRKKYGLPYSLLCDTEHQVAEAYGVWKEKSMYGRKYFGIERTTFVIGADGRIQKIFSKVKPAGHAAEVAAVLT
jgi:peroxiredoxin Q/BCP